MDTKKDFPPMILQRRRTGYTTWVLRAAILDPKCVILSCNQDSSRDLERRYNRLIKEYGWFRRLWWKITFRGRPQFISFQDPERLKGSKHTIIPDNSMFFGFY